jgi:hypothetical protein
VHDEAWELAGEVLADISLLDNPMQRVLRAHVSRIHVGARPMYAFPFMQWILDLECETYGSGRERYAGGGGRGVHSRQTSEVFVRGSMREQIYDHSVVLHELGHAFEDMLALSGHDAFWAEDSEGREHLRRMAEDPERLRLLRWHGSVGGDIEEDCGILELAAQSFADYYQAPSRWILDYDDEYRPWLRALMRQARKLDVAELARRAS